MGVQVLKNYWENRKEESTLDNTNTNPDKIPELDSETANQLLNNIFAECEVVPNAIPLETLESWGNFKKTEFRLGRVISYVVLVILVLLPLLFFRPTIIAQRTNVDSTDNAVYEIQVRTLLPVDGVSATIDGTPVSLEKVNSKNYMVAIPQNGTLLIKATSINGQYSVKKYEVTHLDMNKPELVRSYTENGYINIVVRDTYSGIDYDGITGTGSDGNTVEPESVDKDNETITFKIPSQPVNILIPDNSGNTLEILISPTE